MVLLYCVLYLQLLDHLRSTDTPKALSSATTVQAGAGDIDRTDPGTTLEYSVEPHVQGTTVLLQQHQHQHQPQQQHHHQPQHHHQQGPYSTPSSTVGATRITILVVDDSNISSKLAVRKLASLGHRTVHADNGLNALEMLRSGQEVDLVLLDIVMPVMDGVELLTILQADEALRHIPVVMLSGLEDKILAEVYEHNATGGGAKSNAGHRDFGHNKSSERCISKKSLAQQVYLLFKLSSPLASSAFICSIKAKKRMTSHSGTPWKQGELSVRCTACSHVVCPCAASSVAMKIFASITGNRGLWTKPS
ncbi:hypothetical protein JKP88DRAFT_292802 [Tribonema minus]|uniref:Response regulatory domain-containing protein n=1 Tax=Tribonema minus TaxID=303371 RepID=A0A835ZEX5_9STRA|nr:hypothetical protein JKP88DRAFT_292802 [Tribonema minus]